MKETKENWKFYLMTNLRHNSFVYVYFNSLHVSSIKMLIVRRFNCINTISGICHSENKWIVYGGDSLVCRFGRNCSSVKTCIPNSHLHRLFTCFRVTYTRYRSDTNEYPDDEHLDARKIEINVYKIEINVYKKITVRQVGHEIELYRDARSTGHKLYWKLNSASEWCWERCGSQWTFNL